MSSMIEFTKNHRDHSSDHGFQFEFFCDKCGGGYMSRFVPNKIGIMASIVQVLGSMFSNRGYQMGYAGQQVKDLFRGKARDDAFSAAVQQGRTHFKQCTRCGRWVCPKICWNDKANLCESCAPNLAEEAAAAQAVAAQQQVQEKAKTVDHVAHIDMSTQQIACCPHCNASVSGGKFCTSCGKPLIAPVTRCAKCGTSFGGQFCPQCGTPVAAR